MEQKALRVMVADKEPSNTEQKEITQIKKDLSHLKMDVKDMKEEMKDVKVLLAQIIEAVRTP